ncbi:MAG: hypothetical protein ACREOI_29745 [bacterium]
MKLLRTSWFWGAFFMLLPETNSAQQGLNVEGYVGLGHVNTAETLGQNNMVLGLLTRYTQYGEIDPRGEVGEVLFAFAYGLTNNFDLAILVPYVTIDLGRNDLDKTSFALKYKLIERGHVSVALLPKIRLPIGGAKNLVRAEQPSTMIEVGTRIQNGAQKLYVNLGYGRVDYIDRFAYQVKISKMMKIGVGFTYDFSTPITAFAEVTGERLIGQIDDNLYFQLGGIWRIKKHLILKASAGMGLLDKNRAIIDQRAITGFSYCI